MPGNVTALDLFRRPHAGMLHSVCAAAAHARRARIERKRNGNGGGAHSGGPTWPINLNTLISRINFGKDDEPSMAADKVATGRADRSHRLPTARGKHMRRRESGVDYAPLLRCRRREALKSGELSSTRPPRTLSLSDVYDHQKCARHVERGSRGRSRPRTRYQSPDEQRRPNQRLDRATAPRRMSSKHRRRPCLLARYLRQDSEGPPILPLIGKTVGGGFGARWTRSPNDRHSGRDADRRPGRYQLGREEEMQFGSPRGAERI